MAEPTTRPRALFSLRSLRQQILMDSALRWGSLVVVLLAALASFVVEGGAGLGTMVAFFLILVAWLAVSSLSARVSRQLPQISALIEENPTEAEAQIRDNLRRRPLVRWVRLMLYHRLAALRHRQQAYPESAAICQAILGYPLGPARHARPHLLLMLAEARLQMNDIAGAFPPLLELYWTRLNLIEALQRLALQTRYEVMAGHHHAALHHVHRKVELAELLPAPQAGAFHALLATAARHTGHAELADWLWSRATLLCDPEQLQQIESSGYGLGVVAHIDSPPVA